MRFIEYIDTSVLDRDQFSIPIACIEQTRPHVPFLLIVDKFLDLDKKSPIPEIDREPLIRVCLY